MDIQKYLEHEVQDRVIHGSEENSKKAMAEVLFKQQKIQEANE